MQILSHSLLTSSSSTLFIPSSSLFFAQFKPPSSSPSSSSSSSLKPHNNNNKPSLFSNKKPKNPNLNPNPNPNPNPTLSRFDPNEDLKDPEPPLNLLTKPSPISLPEDPTPGKTEEMDSALAPFLKFFKPGDSDEEEEAETNQNPSNLTQVEQPVTLKVRYYEPKAGDFVVGVVVSGNENKLDVNVGADYLGTMLSKEVMPMYNGELEYLLCDVEKEKDVGLVKGKMGIVKDEEALNREKVAGRPVVETGTVVFAEVLGRTLSGRPLLSSRRMYRRVAWHRAR